MTSWVTCLYPLCFSCNVTAEVKSINSAGRPFPPISIMSKRVGDVVLVCMSI
ncbi:hypothetical protein PF005_g16260 [Phytophthora fragariae]|uniref:Uncharacterized protein n=2 Tax=Phytophthora TaxID=4783 RepID=A0A6A3T954_9STRA|nr:hypothetical protein PF003_g37435 [Phytophthora fragariae]KAE8967577.1 hypothetical protein PR001_g28062 [Phytophthora rubi]KAE8933966.1 hypothetical protein PF009_g16046 [Phytophthora fragariae]KAE8973853.1 hypothetical protein PR002_g26075 [Phytophthora rubi]KAE8998820.1 hypothetical protein PF011_g14893 [Phytophthora fragariae]